MCGESSAARELERAQPKLAEKGFSPDVNVRAFVAVEAVKEESVGAWNVGYARHSPTVTLGDFRGTIVQEAKIAPLETKQRGPAGQGKHTTPGKS
jgi:hypothetical protein